MQKEGAQSQTQLVPRPASGNTTTVTFSGLKIGIWAMTASAYPNADGTGVAQATGSAPVNIADNQTSNVGLTMDSTIDHLEVSPSPPLIDVGTSQQLTATAKDASGAIVLIAPSKLTFDSNNKNAATVSANGLVNGLAQGFSSITVTEVESGKQVSVTASILSVSIYISDSNNARLVRMNNMLGANWTTYALPGTGPTSLPNPYGLFVDSSDHIYGTQSFLTRIFRMDDMLGTNFTTLHSSPTNDAFLGPFNLVVRSSGIYVVDGSRIVRMDDIAGAGWTSYGAQGNGVGQFTSAVGIAVSTTGQIYVADTNDHRIVRIDNMTGANWISYGTAGSGVGQFSSPHGVTLDKTGRIYIADTANNRIVRMDDMNGSNWVSFGVHGSGVGQLETPWCVVLDGVGRIYISDSGNNRIVRIDDMTGANWKSFGSLGSGQGQFSAPLSIFAKINSNPGTL
jgi:streptogramin lyase